VYGDRTITDRFSRRSQPEHSLILAMNLPRCGAGGPPQLDAAERSWLKQALMPQFGVTPSITDGFLLKVWKSGPEKGQARMSPPVERMVGRELLIVLPAGTGQRAFLSTKGLQALRDIFQQGLLSITEFGNLYAQLGLPPADASSGHQDEMDSVEGRPLLPKA